jgi:hypothetical protein
MIYVISLNDSHIVKIGHGGNPKKRVMELQIGSPTPLLLQWVHEGDEDLENHLHAVFREYRIRGEWFDLTPLGDAVAAVQKAVAEAGELARVKPARFRGPAVVHPVTMAAEAPRRSKPGTSFTSEPSWERRFGAPQRSISSRANDARSTKPGCIRAWQGQCQRPAGTTCDC